MIEKDRQDMSNPIGLYKLMLCSVFALLPYPHKAGVSRGLRLFEFYNLVPNLTVKENIQVCEYLSKSPLELEELLNVLGLTEHQNKFPSQLSGGQQQRCAIARALIKNPKVLLCDEPTGALDSNTSREILILLERINKQYGTTMLIVTHNNSIKNMVDHVIYLKDGQIHKDYRNDVKIPAGELEDL
ncbi:MAG: ABC transporter ATP-binding protein [Saccharofermentans sp.]|nr:ABC transporter ATP-binding protein [Saccharofermentans sp.]